MKYILTGLTLSLLLTVKAQVKVSNDTLHWNKDTLITWSDFKGEPIEGSVSTGQVLCLNLGGFQRQSAHHYMQFNIVSVFDRMNSWMPKDKQTEDALDYFQVMFNIYEVHSRLMRKEFEVSRSGVNPDIEFQEKYSHSANNRATELNKFKRETKMGLDSIAIDTWRLRVDEKLKTLEAYMK
ncbi:hypothetical protein OAE48_01175 [Flavobacteriales bacterium]|nr:hypothetical protein [Flavobacteriales bacterium]